jgi:phosphate/sulfate permease
MWQVVAENMIPIVFMIITPVVSLFVAMLLRKLAKKWHLESALQYEDKVDELVIKGIKAVEQKSLSAVKKGGDMTPGEKKLDEAMKFVNAQLMAMKLPQKAADELKMLIESKIFDGVKEKQLPAPAPAVEVKSEVAVVTPPSA